ncbi:MAG TPA: DUF2946 family protein [Ramlibacter sp.]|nr:DUF2946 family protein [Ramlibacter sp.]
MQRLRTTRFLARFVLAWFALVLVGGAVAGVVHPQSLEVICSGGVMKLVGGEPGDDGQAQATAGLDCPLCAVLAPPPALRTFTQPQPLARAVQSIPAARLASVPGAALPARGPPAFS